MNLIVALLVNCLALYVTDYLVPGIKIVGFPALLVSAIVFGFVNTFIKPIVQLVALPITILTLGIFALVINAAMLGLAAFVVPQFHINDFLSALIGAIILSLTSSILNSLSKPKTDTF